MAGYVGAGSLSRPAKVLELRETSAGTWEWVPTRRAWASIELRSRTNLFSKVGVGARDAAIVVRRQRLTLHHALSWNGTHFFLTSIVSMGRNHLDVGAAVVTPTRCISEGVTFPGVLTEKYAGHTQEEPMSVNTLRLVLVVPKAITLRPGCLVEFRGANWEVLVPHELDEYKNEYEIGRTVDL